MAQQKKQDHFDHSGMCHPIWEPGAVAKGKRR